jgi:hypothetical protein
MELSHEGMGRWPEEQPVHPAAAELKRDCLGLFVSNRKGNSTRMGEQPSSKRFQLLPTMRYSLDRGR